ncbi:anaphase promoting complex, Cdc20, Cdh1, and Ama1 subunits [Scheffersomyces xylosifermentans]|uniref:anaphase promoting complex, Cdc20, Cdh1, and Ama1 subunits n=1 Tax=Scheffersomyces xylosifermentans TaxID=1304137 RepID=UPI00315D82A9
MSHSIFFESPGHESPVRSRTTTTIATANSKKRTYYSSPAVEPAPASLSPGKRLYLHNMSPNVSNKTIYLNHIPSRKNSAVSDLPVISANEEFGPSTTNTARARSSKFSRPTLLKPPLPTIRSQSTIPMPSGSLSLSPKHKLRRTNSLISQGGSSSSSDNQQQSSTTSSDRFIPSRHNSTSSKLHTTNSAPHPDASPQTHIKAQTSKIYQHHVAEACGIEMNSRVLLYQPLPPERKKPINLFSHISGTSDSKSKLTGKSSLRPAAASARAKKIPTAPERVLDAPGFVDDFYLNLLAWSSTNLLAIGLEDAVYVWNASTGSVGILCELPDKTLVTSLRWSDDGSYISIGKDDGLIEIWDIETNTKLRTINCNNHQTRIASQAWSQHILTSGSRLGNLYHSDVRIASHVVTKMENTHTAEICGIEYRSDGQQFATGGNDNLVCIWDVRQSHQVNATVNTAQPLFTKANHKAAVKALSWCPYQPSLLATGGGSSDKTINFWNSTTGARVNTIETGSQISSLNWGYAAGTGLEIVATHGFPTNNVSLFNYPTLQKTGEIVGAHDSRILSGCLSPDSLTLATVAGDENLKFWSIFDLYKPSRRDGSNERLNNDNDDESDLMTKGQSKSMKKMMNLR